MSSGKYVSVPPRLSRKKMAKNCTNTNMKPKASWRMNGMKSQMRAGSPTSASSGASSQMLPSTMASTVTQSVKRSTRDTRYRSHGSTRPISRSTRPNTPRFQKR